MRGLIVRHAKHGKAPKIIFGEEFFFSLRGQFLKKTLMERGHVIKNMIILQVEETQCSFKQICIQFIEQILDLPSAKWIRNKDYYVHKWSNFEVYASSFQGKIGIN